MAIKKAERRAVEVMVKALTAAGDLAGLRKYLRQHAGFTQKQIAMRWGVSQSFVSAVERGDCRSYDNENDYAKLLGLKHLELFDPHPDHLDADRPVGH